MKLIIAGSRNIKPSISFLEGCIIDMGIIKTIEQIVSGGATGVDYSAKQLTEEKFSSNYLSMKLYKNYKEFPADWDTHGKAAGPIRNKQMAEYADALLLIWDGESKGSANMKKEMLKLGKPIYEVILKKYN